MVIFELLTWSATIVADTFTLFIKTVGIYPMGSMVELNTKERALVYEPNPGNPRKPVVAVLTMPNKKSRGIPIIMNLAKRSESGEREIATVLDPNELHVDTEKIMQIIRRRGERDERKLR